MKNRRKALLLALVICSPLITHHGHCQKNGGAAIVKSVASHSDSRTEANANRALKEQQRERLHLLEGDSNKQKRGHKDPWFIILIGLVFMMFVAVVGLGTLVLTKK